MFLTGTILSTTADCRGRVYLDNDLPEVSVPEGMWGICDTIIGEWCKLVFDICLDYEENAETTAVYGKKKTNRVWINQMYLTRKFEG